MARRLRVASGGYAYHVLNRAVESLASSPRRRGGTGGRGSATAAATLATTRAIPADTRRTGIAAALGGPRRTVWRGVLAEADGEEIGPGIDAPPSRPAVEDRSVAKTPDPFIVPVLQFLGRNRIFSRLKSRRSRWLTLSRRVTERHLNSPFTGGKITGLTTSRVTDRPSDIRVLGTSPMIPQSI
jgi:hypothetical protein